MEINFMVWTLDFIFIIVYNQEIDNNSDAKFNMNYHLELDFDSIASLY